MTGSHKSVGLFILTAAAIVGAWWWLGSGVAMPRSPLDQGEKLYCVSYAPFHGAQSPLDPTTLIPPAQIDADLSQLARIADCVRTYSVDFGIDRVPEMARKHGLKVLLGVWLSSRTERNWSQIETGIALAKRFPDVITAVIVGNEALLRGEISPADLADAIRNVKQKSQKPVTYADVWEFWLRHRELASVVDFVTVHILPYWEDMPIPAEQAADHVASIRRIAAGAFPGKEIVIGETGWPSAGRMREAALPSLANQARAVHDILARGKRDGFRVNVIEAYDQPWKRFLEGTVGGHWGLLDDAGRTFKFTWGEPVSNHPNWRWQATGGVALAALVFLTGILARRRIVEPPHLDRHVDYLLAVDALIAGLLAGWAIENMIVESLGFGGWLRSGALVAVALTGPIVAAAALAANATIPCFDRVLAAAEDRIREPLALVVGIALIALCVLAVQTALGLAFDPRYRDFPFAPLTAATMPFLLLSFKAPQLTGPRGNAERVSAGVLSLSAIYIAYNESLANWQSLWLCLVLLALAFILARVRAAPG
jgi:exo-beta-1,3-glucanase (GH17 family)